MNFTFFVFCMFYKKVYRPTCVTLYKKLAKTVLCGLFQNILFCINAQRQFQWDSLNVLRRNGPNYSRKVWVPLPANEPVAPTACEVVANECDEIPERLFKFLKFFRLKLLSLFPLKLGDCIRNRARRTYCLWGTSKCDELPKRLFEFLKFWDWYCSLFFRWTW